ncbi:MAG: methylated-DNA--[protein]-cysteine S-methyltransferase [Pseudomonadota bacterium]|nr:methylated-DNA--[protein]-cysteine S-methyltransferase [Burkholderiaceae bacterium]MDQ3444553.1 methylated-DNA--[protein]-cysteine S-methyltransferase [Pseudomonadota bacterium]
MLSAPGLQFARTATAERFDAVARLPFGLVGVRARGACVEEIRFLTGEVQLKPTLNSLAQRVIDQLLAYCADSSTPIELPLAIEGTDFQRQVWNEIARIPPGSTQTYGALARRVNGAARAVGQACGDNRLPLAIPCHRVVGASGIGGFAHHRGGAYERIKRWLLVHEAGTELRLV